jgi:hypothetical protein
MRTSVSDGAETPAAGIDMLGSDMLQSYLGTSGSTSPVASDVMSSGASASEPGDQSETLMSASSPGASTDSAISVPEESSDATPLLESTCSVESGPDGENYGQPALPEGITAPRYVSLHSHHIGRLGRTLTRAMCRCRVCCMWKVEAPSGLSHSCNPSLMGHLVRVTSQQTALISSCSTPRPLSLARRSTHNAPRRT